MALPVGDHDDVLAEPVPHQAGLVPEAPEGRIKVMNESIYYNVDKLHTAIAGQKAITFKYFDFDISRKKVFPEAPEGDLHLLAAVHAEVFLAVFGQLKAGVPLPEEGLPPGGPAVHGLPLRADLEQRELLSGGL